MALIVTKESVENLIISPRENMVAPFLFDGGWNEIRCGIFFSIVSSSYDNGDGLFELRIADDVTDWFTMGISNGSGGSIPGQAGSSFVGISSHGSALFDGTNLFPKGYNRPPIQPTGSISNRYTDANKAVTYRGTILDDGGPLSNGRLLFNEASTTSNYCAFFCLKFLVRNAGASNQTIGISAARDDTYTAASYSPQRLLTAINSAAFGSEIIMDWSDGGSARAIPENFWVRLPFFRNRLRITTLRIIKYG